MMENIRASIDRLKGEEIRTLQEKEQALDRSLSRTIWILLVSSIAGVLFLALANGVVVVENRRRRTAEKELISANENLERRIIERTAELQSVNDSLKQTDIDRDRLLEAERAVRDDAEAANKLRDEFMAIVSHELRTPLNSILGWGRLMQDGALTLRSFVVRSIRSCEAPRRSIV